MLSKTIGVTTIKEKVISIELKARYDLHFIITVVNVISSICDYISYYILLHFKWQITFQRIFLKEKEATHISKVASHVTYQQYYVERKAYICLGYMYIISHGKFSRK